MTTDHKEILLASHGTVGAQAAEQKTFKLCNTSTHITHLIVVPEFWKDMLGDDWLNNSKTRIRFGDYLESELEKEVDQTIKRVQEKADSLGIRYTSKVTLGDPEKCLLDINTELEFDLVVVGSKRPKALSGLHSRMLSNLVSQHLSTKLLSVPHPNA